MNHSSANHIPVNHIPVNHTDRGATTVFAPAVTSSLPGKPTQGSGDGTKKGSQ